MQPVVTPSYSTALPIPSVVEFKPSQVRELLLRHRVRASVVQVGVGGMPYCGKSTLVCNMLEFGSTSLQVHTHTLAHTHIGSTGAFELIVDVYAVVQEHKVVS